MSGQVDLIAALVAGVVSFLSPCVLAIIPGYVSFLGGLAGGTRAERGTRDVIVPALLFVAGFTAVFVALGVSASLLGSLLRSYRDVLTIVGGVLVIAFGVLLLGIIKVPWLYGEARIDAVRAVRLGKWAAPVMGMAFAFAWTPCVGPVLGAILMLAGSEGQAGRGALLLLVYSAGLAVPFMATALLIERVRSLVRAAGRYALVLNRVAGAVLIILGLLIVSGRLAAVTAWLSRLLPGFGTG